MTDALQDTVKFRNKPRGSYSSKALFEGLIFGGAYLWREITISKLIVLALQLEGNLPFLLCFTLYLRAISKYKPQQGLYLEGQFSRALFLCYEFGGLHLEGLIFGILWQILSSQIPLVTLSFYTNIWQIVRLEVLNLCCFFYTQQNPKPHNSNQVQYPLDFSPLFRHFFLVNLNLDKSNSPPT